MDWSIFWLIFDLYLSSVLLVAVIGLVGKAALLARLHHLGSLGNKRKVWREAIEAAGTGAVVALFVEHPRVVLVLVFASGILVIWYWQRKGWSFGAGTSPRKGLSGKGPPLAPQARHPAASPETM